MHAYLIDYENVGREGLVGIGELGLNDYVKIFYSNNSNIATEGIREDILGSRAKVESHRVSITQKNALDFQLVTFLGRISVSGKFDKVSIISRDNGFYAARLFLRGEDRSLRLDQFPTIIEAHIAEENQYTEADLNRRAAKKKLDEIIKELDRKKQYRTEIRECVPGITDSELEQIETIYLSIPQKQRIYREMLKSFGRERGLQIYRNGNKGNWVEKVQAGA